MDATRKYFVMRKPDLQKLQNDPNTPASEKQRIEAELKRRANRRKKKNKDSKTY